MGSSYKKTLIIDENNEKIEIDLKDIPFIPNKNINFILKIISNNINENIQVLKPGGEPRRDYISDLQDNTHKYIMVHSTPNSGIRYKYSSIEKESDHFGIKKIIFGETGYTNMVIDKEGTFGITSSSYGIKITENNDFDIIKKALNTNKFKLLIDSCMWSNYRIDWRLFTYLKKDFWKEFI